MWRAASGRATPTVSRSCSRCCCAWARSWRPPPGAGSERVARSDAAQLRWLEAEIDRLDAELPPLRNFLLPGGTPAAAALHVARTVCRRAERLVVALRQEEAIGPQLLPCLNRLSDLLFVLARTKTTQPGATRNSGNPERRAAARRRNSVTYCDESQISFRAAMSLRGILVLPLLLLTGLALPAAAQAGNWTAEYFNNPSLAGQPVVVRSEASPRGNWGPGAPHAGVPADFFSVRWTTNVPLAGGSWQLSAQADDGVRVLVDGALVIDEWRVTGGEIFSSRSLSCRRAATAWWWSIWSRRARRM